MTPQQMIGVAARLFAVWLAINALQSIGIAQALAAQGNQRAMNWLPFVFAGIYLLGAALLWFFPMAVAHRLVPRTRFEDRITVPAQQAATVACVIVGLLVIVFRALPSLSAYLALAAYWIANGAPLSSLSAERHLDALSGAIQLLVGASLVVKAHAFAEKFVPAQDSSAADPMR